jgi:hypothetical protein
MNKPANPPAFPVEIVSGGKYLGVKTSEITEMATGMSLRDYFASQALPSIMQDWSRYSIPQRKFDFTINSGDADVIAEQAYLIADSMLRMIENG